MRVLALLLLPTLLVLLAPGSAAPYSTGGGVALRTCTADRSLLEKLEAGGAAGHAGALRALLALERDALTRLQRIRAAGPLPPKLVLLSARLRTAANRLSRLISSTQPATDAGDMKPVRYALATAEQATTDARQLISELCNRTG